MKNKYFVFFLTSFTILSLVFASLSERKQVESFYADDYNTYVRPGAVHVSLCVSQYLTDITPSLAYHFRLDSRILLDCITLFSFSPHKRISDKVFLLNCTMLI
jgi:hypothetical protein